jgi:perosamine synthetase
VARTHSIPITRIVVGDEELRAVQVPLETGWVVQGPFVREFEEKFAGYTGAAHAVATSSGTSALHVALAALGVGPGDEVIVPGFTWVSTANVVEHLGGKAIFCDIDLATYNIDTGKIEALVTDRTVGIVPVHLFGLSADLDPILELARSRELWVLEDCACSFGGWYHGRHTGTIGDAGCFSFHPRKSITTGEGGMVTTASDEFAALVAALRDHGASRSDHERHESSGGFLLSEYEHLGFNFRLTDIQGALGSAQMDRADDVLDGRRRCAAVYDELLVDLPWLRRPVVPHGYLHGYQAYVCLFCPEEPTLDNVHELHGQRNALMADLERRGISTRQGTHSPVLTSLYANKYGLRPEDYPASVIADRLSLAVPLFPQLTEDEQQAVAEGLRAAFG